MRKEITRSTCSTWERTRSRATWRSTSISTRPFRLVPRGRTDWRSNSGTAGSERAQRSEPRDRSAPTKRRARARVGQSEGRSPSDREGGNRGNSIGRRGAGLHGGHHDGPRQLSRMEEHVMGRALLAPARLHAGVHDRAGGGLGPRGRIREAEHARDRPQRRFARRARSLEGGHQGRDGARAELPADCRSRQENREALRHDPPELERYRDRALGVRDRARPQGEALAHLSGEHGAELPGAAPRDRLAAADGRPLRRDARGLETGRAGHHRARRVRRGGEEALPRLHREEAVPARHRAAVIQCRRAVTQSSTQNREPPSPKWGRRPMRALPPPLYLLAQLTVARRGGGMKWRWSVRSIGATVMMLVGLTAVASNGAGTVNRVPQRTPTSDPTASTPVIWNDLEPRGSNVPRRPRGLRAPQRQPSPRERTDAGRVTGPGCLAAF